MTRRGLHAAVLEDFENQRSNSVRWLSGHPMDALLFLFASGTTVLVPWDVNIARERSVVDRIMPYTEFKRSFKDAVKGVLRENGDRGGRRRPAGAQESGVSGRARRTCVSSS